MVRESRSTRWKGVFSGSAALLLLSALSLHAQDLGSVAGTVTDPSGAAIPGVKITITNQRTGTARETTTNAEGNYVAAGLPASTYTVRAEQKGFTTAVRSDLVVNVRSELRADFKLELGSVSQEVTVSAPAVHLETQNASVSQAVTAKHVEALDINGRNFVQLATLVPGATGPSLVGSLNAPVGVTSNTGINFNGQRQAHNVWSVDGQDNYDRGCGGCIEVVPDQDAIQEMKVLSSNASQDLGFGSAAHIQVELKSGTQTYHGEVFEFNRNRALEAQPFFLNAAGKKRPYENYNNFGFNLGGPLALRGHEKKTFFFFTANWRRLIQGSTITTNGVPTDWTTGLFDSGSPVILDHTKPFTCGTATCYEPFPNNLIPLANQDPNAVILAKPNFIFNSANSGSLFVGGVSIPTKVNEQIVRIDHHFSDKTSLMFHYIRDGIDQQFVPTLWAGSSYATVGTDFLNQPQSFLLKLTRSISPTLLNEALIGFNRQPLTLLPIGTFMRPSGLTIQELFPGNEDNRIPVISFGGPLNNNWNPGSWPWNNVLNTWSFRDSATKIAGNHTLNFGMDYQHYLKQQKLFGATNGNFNFNGSATSGSYIDPTTGAVVSTPGNSFADFLLGDAFSYTELEIQSTPAYINNFYGPFVGDTWRVRSNLTLNLGLRWEGLPHAYEQHNQVAVFRPSLYDPATAPQLDSSGHILPGSGNLLDGIGIAGQNGIPRGLVDNHWKNFEPRIGVAWQVHPNTVLRTGFGLFYENIQGNDIYNVAPNPPFSNSPQIFNTNLSNPGGGTATINPSNIQAYDPAYLQPYSMQWNAGIEHQFTGRTIFSISYLGTKGTHQQINRNINQPLAPAGSANLNTVRPYLGFANINWYENSSSSNYNSLQASLRFADWHGLTSDVAYTYSHCLDYVDNDNPGTINNAYNLGAEYGHCGFDVRHTFIANYVYTLPFFNTATGAQRAFLGGWQVSGITTLYSGLPYTASTSGDPAQCGCGGYRANQIGDPNSGSGLHTQQKWFNPAAFAPLPAGFVGFGDAARNTIRGAGIANFDFSVFKNFAGIRFPANKEGATLQLRFEFYNLFNTTQFNGFSTNVTSSNFGAATSTRLPRQIQLGAKFIF